jgi:hypothetical protein
MNFLSMVWHEVDKGVKKNFQGFFKKILIYSHILRLKTGLQRTKRRNTANTIWIFFLNQKKRGRAGHSDVPRFFLI